MTEATSPAEVVERLEARARHADVRKAGAEFNGMAFMAAEEVETARDLRAAASLIRELTEALNAADDVFGQVASRVDRENRMIDDEHIDPAWKAISSLAFEGRQIVRNAMKGGV